MEPAGCWLPLAGTPSPPPPLAARPRRDPLFDAMHHGWWPGLPCPLQDLRPQGHLIVGETALQRWQAQRGVDAVVQHAGRTCLEVERFDRHGPWDPPAQRSPWLQACPAANGFWADAAADSRISAALRTVAAANAQALQALRERA